MPTSTIFTMTPFQVVADLGAIQQSLDAIERDWENGRFTTAYTVQSGNVTKDAYMADVAAMRNLLEEIAGNPEATLRRHVDAIRKKKNGLLWSRSGVTIRMMDSVSEYFTDFTNAWNVAQLRLEVVNDTTCELVLRFRTETY